MKHEPAGRCGRVDILSQGPKPGATLSDGLHDVEKIAQGPCEAIVPTYPPKKALLRAIDWRGVVFPA